MRVLVVQNVKGGCFQQQGHDFAVMHAAHGMMQDVAPVHIPDVEVHSYMSSTDVGEANRGFLPRRSRSTTSTWPSSAANMSAVRPLLSLAHLKLLSATVWELLDSLGSDCTRWT